MMHFQNVIFLVLPTLLQLNAQTIQCNSLAGGCDNGTAHNAALRSAIANFEVGKVYGGGDVPIVFSSSLDVDGTSLAQISYSCLDGSVPPTLAGSLIQSSLQNILSCPDQCGSVSVTNNCGFGVLIAEDAAGASCFANAINVVPNGELPSEEPFVGTFNSLGCWTDSTEARALTGGSSTSADMTVEKCVALAKGFKYAGVEYATECYWGNSIASTASVAPGQCTMSCGGQPLEVCGDGNRIDIYQDLAYASPASTSSTATGASSSSSTSSLPSPTVVPSVGDFGNTGCFFDSTSAQVLVANSIVDQSATGMTVEKCVAFAQNGSWRFAGVEFGSQCFVGNTLHNATGAAQGDCSMPCAGNNAELCGDGNRIQVYEDSTWIDPTAADLAAILQLYKETLAQVLDAVSKYKSDIAVLQAEQEQSQDSKVRRQLQTETIELQEITQDYQRLQVVQQLLAQAAQQGNRLFVIASNDDVDRPTAPLVPSDALDELTSATSTAGESLDEVVSAAGDDAATIASSTTPLLNFGSDLAVSEAAVDAIGLPAVLGPAGIAATGIFLVISGLFSLFDHASSGGQSPPMTTTGIPTTTTTTASASSSSTLSVCSACDCILGTPVPMPALPPDDTLTNIDLDWPLTDTPITSFALPDEPDDIPDVANDVLVSRSFRFTNSYEADLRSTQMLKGNHDIVEFDNKSAEHILDKRYTGCSLTYDNLNYPSTASYANSNPPPANSADLVPAIRKWVDFQVNPGVDGACTWSLVAFLARQGTQEYATEHVYEKHFIGTFLKWLVFDGNDYGPVTTCTVVNNVFGRVSTTNNSPFSTTSPIAQLSDAFSCYLQQCTDNTRVTEFFILNADVNKMKTTILSYNQDTASIPRVTGTWQELWQRIRTAQLAFSYMRRFSVYNAFDDTHGRMRSIIQQIDNDPFYVQFGVPQVQTEVGGSVQYPNWTAAFDAWMGQFLRLKQFKMQAWIQNAVATLIAGINADNTLVPQQQQNLVSFVQEQSQGTGLMSEDNMVFGPRYATLMSF